MPDNPSLTDLSDGELDATLLLLGERAQEITNATALVRQEQASRRARAESQIVLGDEGVSALTVAVGAAPARARELEREAAKKAAEAAVEEAAEPDG